MSDGHLLTGFFCDDVRSEAGSKLSFMGCYGSEMIVPQFPAKNIRLMFVYQFYIDKKEIGDKSENIDIKILQNGLPLSGMNFDIELKNSPDLEVMTNKSLLFGALNIIAGEIEKPSLIEVNYKLEGRDIDGPSLTINQNPSQQRLHT